MTFVNILHTAQLGENAQKFDNGTSYCDCNAVIQHDLLRYRVSVVGHRDTSRSHLASALRRPKFCPNATWNATARTLAGSGHVGNNPWQMVVTSDNSIYVSNVQQARVVVWNNGSLVPTQNLSIGHSTTRGIFVSESKEIYLDKGDTTDRVEKWTSNGTESVSVLHVCRSCFALFIDDRNRLYCALNLDHQVVATSLDGRVNLVRTVAGTGSAGSTSMTLNQPRGLFVDENFDMYVVDQINNRVQLFRAGQLNASTVAGSTAPMPFTLSFPSFILLDADGYLFISDNNNNRIVGSGPNGFRCLVGCTGGAGGSMSQLYYPRAFGFLSNGDLVVLDSQNERVQIFSILSNPCRALSIVSKRDNRTAFETNF
jgi:hypothetical protein